MGANTPLKVNGVWVCVECMRPVANSIGGRLHRPPRRCREHGAAHTQRIAKQHSVAQYAVSRAIASGQLKRAAEFSCVDCGKPARHYDHREYAKPLQVEPVCQKCNVRRGPAIDAASLGIATHTATAA